MKVRATKVMANAIAKAMNELGVKFDEIACVKLSERSFNLNVGDPYLECHERDYDWENCTFNVIRVVYPYEYYANPCYLSSRKLAELFNRSDHTWNSFVEQIQKEIEV